MYDFLAKSQPKFCDPKNLTSDSIIPQSLAQSVLGHGLAVALAAEQCMTHQLVSRKSSAAGKAGMWAAVSVFPWEATSFRNMTCHSASSASKENPNASSASILHSSKSDRHVVSLKT